METWFLLLWMSGHSRPIAIIPEPFNTRWECEHAGKEVYDTFYYKCVRGPLKK
jgi:hypothetical protein